MMPKVLDITLEFPNLFQGLGVSAADDAPNFSQGDLRPDAPRLYKRGRGLFKAVPIYQQRRQNDTRIM